MGVSVAGGPTPGRRNSGDQGSAEYKLRLFRPSLCYLGYSPHSCLSYLPYSLYLRLLFNGKDSTRNRNFLFIDMQQVAILKVDTYVSFFGLFRMDVGVYAHSANIFTTFIFSFSNSVFSSGEYSFFGAHPSQFPSFLSKLACTNFEAVLLLTSIPGRKINRDLVPLKGFARSLKNKFNLA